MTLQTIVSREVDPAHPSVVSVGQFSAGSAPNVIAGYAELHGTIRCQDNVIREQLSSSITRIARSVADLHGASAEVDIRLGTPPLINTTEQAEIARHSARKVVGNDQVLKLRTENMGAEDFAYFLEHIPGAYVRFGAQVPGREGFPAHSSRFDFDEKALPIGAAYLAQVARVAGAHFDERFSKE
jgi:hippurate hydrolase